MRAVLTTLSTITIALTVTAGCSGNGPIYETIWLTLPAPTSSSDVLGSDVDVGAADAGPSDTVTSAHIGGVPTNDVAEMPPASDLPHPDAAELLGSLDEAYPWTGIFSPYPMAWTVAARSGAIVTVLVAGAWQLAVYGPAEGWRYHEPPIATAWAGHGGLSFDVPVDGHYLVVAIGVPGAPYAASLACVGEPCTPVSLGTPPCPPRFLGDVGACLGEVLSGPGSSVDALREAVEVCTDAEVLADVYDAGCEGAARDLTCGLPYEVVWSALRPSCQDEAFYRRFGATCRFGARFRDLWAVDGPVVITGDEVVHPDGAPSLPESVGKQLIAALAPLAPSVGSVSAAFDAIDSGELRVVRFVDLSGKRYTALEFGLGDNAYGAIFTRDGLSAAARIVDGELVDCVPAVGLGTECGTGAGCAPGLSCIGQFDGVGRCAAFGDGAGEEPACTDADDCPIGEICVGLSAGGGACAPVWSTGGAWDVPLASIPDRGSVTRTLTVRGVGMVVRDVEVRVTVAHPDPTQLRLTLVSPSGASVVLFDGKPGPDGLIVSRVVPEFAGDAPARGVWTLLIRDSVSGGLGYLESWSLRVAATGGVPP